MEDYTDLFSKLDGNKEYDEYLSQHIENVQKGYEWIKNHIPDVLKEDNYIDEFMYYGELDDIIANHDQSKYRKVPDYDNYFELTTEYDAYADYFYGNNSDDKEVKDRFNHAWLAHIHANPHHWQHWMLQNDEDGLILLDMPYVFIVEMICDWWSFSWKNENLREIFSWYNKHKLGILLSDKTRKTVESILQRIKEEIDNEYKG